MKRALEGVRVLDLTRVLSGPFCTAMLADMGADVIKVEHPKGGDGSREPWVSINGESVYFMSLNRGKKGITLNLKHPEGIDILKRLVAEADVVVENFRPGVMDKLGLSYENLKAIKADLIYVSISGFGKNSPMGHLPAFDLIAQAMGGIMSINGQPGDPPTRVGVSLGDTATSLYTAFAVVTALFARQRYGIGQYIDASMVDSIYSLLEMSLFQYLAGGATPGQIGSRHPTSYPYDVFRASDGFFVVATYDNTGFKRLCDAMGRQDLPAEAHFETDIQRGLHAAELKKIIEGWSTAMTVVQVLDVLEKHLVPCSPIFDIAQISESEHIKARRMLVEVEHPVAGKTKLPALPVKLSETPAAIGGPSPLLGQHTEQILADVLGLEDQEINRLKVEEVI